MKLLSSFSFSPLIEMLGGKPGFLQSCSSTAFNTPQVFGAEILSITASQISNYSFPLPQFNEHFEVNLTGLDFCKVLVEYTHPGQDDRITVEVWMPSRGWNGRFMGTGGGGFSTSMGPLGLSYAVSQGYSAVATDGGHAVLARDPSPWALKSPGNVNWPLLQDFAAIALDDATTIGKAITTSFYGMRPKYSYWSGCSTGGRQGLMMAQRYPTQYDGILAVAPAINFGKFVPAMYHPQHLMNRLGVYPPQCELEAITEAAIAACDELDGVKDGMISDPDRCTFDPLSLVDQTIQCAETGVERKISLEAAQVALAAWTGLRTTDGRFMWHGMNRDTRLSGIANTECTSSGQCTGSPFTISSDWIKYFVQKDPEFDITKITDEEYERIIRQSHNQYASILGTADPDLTDFRQAGGKMITWHGLIDELIFPNGTYEYYERVLKVDPNAADYYRFFPAPGIEHCRGGIGPFPSTALESLVRWVENGEIPEVLNGTSLPLADGTIRTAPLCPYPLVAAYKGGDIHEATSFRCEESF